jgi:hypothetical protein
MIDRDTAIQWANDAGCHVMQLVVDREGNRAPPTIIASAEQIQALITRARNEALEQAAELCECADNANDHAWHAADQIRALKQEQPK